MSSCCRGVSCCFTYSDATLGGLQLKKLAGLHCRKRIADQQFDDPPKVVPPPPEKQKVVVELDDKRSSKVHTQLQGSVGGAAADMGPGPAYCPHSVHIAEPPHSACRLQVLAKQAACLHCLGELYEEQYISATPQRQQAAGADSPAWLPAGSGRAV